MRDIRGRMQFCAEAVKRLSAKQGIRGQMVSADRGARHFSLTTRLANPLQLDAALKLADPLALETHTPVVIAQREAGVIAYQFQLPERDWQPYTRADLRAGPAIIGVGLAERRRQVNYEFARPHGGFFGATGSGKSVAVDTLLCGLFTAYTPDQLRAVVVDPDGDHAAFAGAANLALPIARADEAIDRVLNYAGAELARRSNAGQREVWRLVVLIDEAEAMLAGGARLRTAQAIARGGRKWSVNLVIATQDPREGTLPDLLPQLMNRWIGAVASAPVSFYLSGHKGLECHKLTMGGDFIHVTGSQAQRLQVAMPTAEDYAALPRAEIAPPEFEPVEVAPERWEDEAGRGRRPDPLDWRLVGRMLAHLAKSPTLADGTLANRLNVGVRKLTRHKSIAVEVLAGLREEIASMA
jgi:hypothetical protein